MARPKKDESEKGHKRVIRATHAEWEAWEVAAESRQTNRSAWLRGVLNRAAKRSAQKKV